jgi:hypothetical protein
MITVQLDVFSGRPNPRWTLTPRQARELAERVQAERAILRPRDAEAGGLGYRGFIIEQSGEDVWSAAGLPRQGRIGGRGAPERDAQAWLLGTSKASADLSGQVVDHARDAIGTSPRDTVSTYTPCDNSYYTSDTDFTFWNNPQHQYLNNCYNFASNSRTDTYAQPGLASGHEYTSLTCRGVAPAARWDGWRAECQPDKNLNTCLVIWPNVDFHWYRLCQNGHWCHKPGGDTARNYDDSGDLITDPETADRGPYTDFCRYFRGWHVVVR